MGFAFSNNSIFRGVIACATSSVCDVKVQMIDFHHAMRDYVFLKNAMVSFLLYEFMFFDVNYKDLSWVKVTIFIPSHP